MAKKKSRRQSCPPVPEEPARPAPAALRGRRNAADALLERLRRGPDPNYDPDKEFEEWYATALANPPVDEVRDRERRAMLETADTLLHSRHRELEAACRADDTTRQKSLLLEIEKMEQGRARWLEFYDSDEFAEQVKASWRAHFDDKEALRTWNQQSAQEARKKVAESQRKVEEWWATQRRTWLSTTQSNTEAVFQLLTTEVIPRLDNLKQPAAESEPRVDPFLPEATVIRLFGVTRKVLRCFLDRHPEVFRKRPLTRKGKPHPRRQIIDVLAFVRAAQRDDVIANSIAMTKRIETNMHRLKVNAELEEAVMKMFLRK